MGDLYRVEQLKKMLTHETSKTEGHHFGAKLMHWYGDSNPLMIDAGGLQALIEHYQKHNLDLGNDDEPTGESVYVYYEENYGELQRECGSITDLALYKNSSDVLTRIAKGISTAREENFVTDYDEAELTPEAIAKKLECRYGINIWCCKGNIDNYDVSYSIVAEKIKIS